MSSRGQAQRAIAAWVAISLLVLILVPARSASATAGITWTSQTSGTTRNLRGVAYSGVLYVAVGDAGGGAGGTILTSPDGVTWTVRAMPDYIGHLKAVAYGGGQFVAVGQTGLTTERTNPTWGAKSSSQPTA